MADSEFMTAFSDAGLIELPGATSTDAPPASNPSERVEGTNTEAVVNTADTTQSQSQSLADDGQADNTGKTVVKDADGDADFEPIEAGGKKLVPLEAAQAARTKYATEKARVAELESQLAERDSQLNPLLETLKQRDAAEAKERLAQELSATEADIRTQITNAIIYDAKTNSGVGADIVAKMQEDGLAIGVWLDDGTQLTQDGYNQIYGQRLAVEMQKPIVKMAIDASVDKKIAEITAQRSNAAQSATTFETEFPNYSKPLIEAAIASGTTNPDDLRVLAQHTHESAQAFGAPFKTELDKLKADMPALIAKERSEERTAVLARIANGEKLVDLGGSGNPAEPVGNGRNFDPRNVSFSDLYEMNAAGAR